MLSMVIKACWMRGGPSRRAAENCLQVRDSKMVGKRVVLSLQMWEIETAAEVLNTSFLVVWYIFKRRVATSKVAKLQPALMD